MGGRRPQDRRRRPPRERRLVLEPGGERLAVQRVFAVPRILGPGSRACRRDEEGFVLAADDAQRQGLRADVGGGRRRSRRSSSAAWRRIRRAGRLPRSPASQERTMRAILASRSSTAGCSSGTAPGDCPDAATPRARRCGGPPGRSRASTCPAGSPSTASPRPPRQNRRKAASPSGGRCGRWRPKPFTCTSSHASSAAPTRRSARSDAGCVRRGSADRPAARAPEPASRSRDSLVDDPRDLQGRESAVTQLLRDTAATHVMRNVLEAGARPLPGRPLAARPSRPL